MTENSVASFSVMLLIFFGSLSHLCNYVTRIVKISLAEVSYM